MNILEAIQSNLRESWSVESSSKWTKDNPAKGQCSVSAVVVYQYFGGEILKTKVDGSWHFYNKVNGIIYDFTSDQFEKEIEYSDIPSSVEEAESDYTSDQLNHLMITFGSKIKMTLTSHGTGFRKQPLNQCIQR